MIAQRTLRAPVQARAHQTRAALLEAAECEFSERGYAQTTAKSIAERAAVATGSFYQYFRDKDAVLHELARARSGELTRRVRAVGRPAGDADSLEQQARLAVRRIVAAVLDHHRKDLGLHAVLTERRHADSELAAIERAGERGFLEHTEASLQHWGYAGDRKALAFVIFGLIEGSVHSHVLGLRVLSDRRFVDALADAVLTLVRAGLTKQAEASVEQFAQTLNDIADIVGREHVLPGGAIGGDYTHDEALTVVPKRPDWLVRPADSAQIARLLTLADAQRVPVTARGSGTGLSGACVPQRGGMLLCFERMKQILEIDEANHVAVVQPGVTLAELDAALLPRGLVYPILPGESGSSLGGNVATNAGGMQAIKYGVTRHHVLGIEAILPGGELIRCGGKFVKVSTGFDLTQLIVGSEGVLALVSEITLKLRPRLTERATLLVPFATLEAVTAAIPRIVATGVDPLVLEYIDMLTMAATLQYSHMELGVPAAIKDKALAYLVVVIEGRSSARVQEDTEIIGALALELGALDLFVLPPQAGSDLLHAREQAFWVAKKAGANDVIDVVVPRAAIAQYMQAVSRIAQEHASLILGCGHVGDGNVHLSVFQPDTQARQQVIKAVYRAGMALGGAISGEHGIGSEKLRYFLELEQPAKIALMRRIKAAFDPNGILNPGVLLG